MTTIAERAALIAELAEAHGLDLLGIHDTWVRDDDGHYVGWTCSFGCEKGGLRHGMKVGHAQSSGITEDAIRVAFAKLANWFEERAGPNEAN